MSSLQLKIFNDYINKLNIPKNDHLAKKGLEIQNQIKAKNYVFNHINDSASIVIALDIGCDLLNIDVTKTELIKLSSLNSSQYNKHRKAILKILHLNKKLTIPEIIRKLAIPHSVEKSAKIYLKTYMEQQQFYENEEIDASVYAMCVYFACKFENIKIAKKNILPLSNLTQGQFSMMQKSWEKWVPNVITKKIIKENKNYPIEIVPNNTTDLTLASNQNLKNSEESYEAWSKRILAQAYKDLKTLNK